MRHAYLVFAGIIMMISTLAVAKPLSDTELLGTTDTLTSYLAEPEAIDTTPYLLKVQYDNIRNVTIQTYEFASQTWPKPAMSTHGVLWKHALIIYKPATVATDSALLFVNGGTRNALVFHDNPPPHEIDFARIAAATNSIVVDLQDIPNQYLTLDDNVTRKEDSIVAYSWSRFLDDPKAGAYWPVHLPMTKAVIKAMDIVQLTEPVKHFVVVGASKRGWATWLAALADERINAIIPVVIDILNTKKNLKHIYASLGNEWPAAFQNYLDENIPARIDTPQFDELLKIEDPLSYLTGNDAEFYKKRLSIPKYIISASGDDFFAADSLNMYLNKLPGETEVRVVPNQPHYINMKIVEDAILSYYQTITKHISRPTLQWDLNKKGVLQGITTNRKPRHVILWEAQNPNKRDFRLAAKIIYLPKALSGTCKNNQCHYAVSIKPPAKGWKASFVEVTYQEPVGEPLILTTPTCITKA